LRHRGAVFLEGGSSFLIWIDGLLVPAWNGQEWTFVLRHGLTASSQRFSSGTYQCRLSSPGLGLRLLPRVYLTFSAYMLRIAKPDIQPPRLTFRLLSMVKGRPASGELNARRPEHKNFLQFWYHHAFIDVCLGLKSNIAWKYGRARARHVLHHHSIISTSIRLIDDILKSFGGQRAGPTRMVEA
jgi:hypothetical protein